MSEEDNELVEEFWASLNFANRFFSPEESQSFLDSFRVNGTPPSILNTEIIHWILDRPRTRTEILDATPEQLKQWSRLSNAFS